MQNFIALGQAVWLPQNFEHSWNFQEFCSKTALLNCFTTMNPCNFCMDWVKIIRLVVNKKYLTLLFHMIWFVNILEKTKDLMTSNLMQNLLKLQKIKEKLKFATWIYVIWYLWLEICKLKLISCFLDQSGHFCMIH